MKKILVFDTSVCTKNLGDFIIMDGVRSQLSQMFEMSMFLHTATHEKISSISYELAKKADFSFVGGSNLLSSNMNYYNQWKINLVDSVFLNDIVLMGVGWWQYQKMPNLYTRYLFKKIFHSKLLHSVRDSYTEKMLRSIGMNNVINTSCASMWDLDEDHCLQIPQGKADKVVTTLTDYNQDPVNDREMLDVLRRSYEEVYFWPQGSGDMVYLRSLDKENDVSVIPPNLGAFDRLLESEESIDFVGTRLHAGVRALQKKRRTIVLGIDNRAYEKSKDFNLQVCPRGNVNELRTLISSNFSTRVNIPIENINNWKKEFQ